MRTHHHLRVLLVSGAVALAAGLGADLITTAVTTAAISHQVLGAFRAA